MQSERTPVHGPSRRYAGALSIFVTAGYASPALLAVVGSLGIIHSSLAIIGTFGAATAWLSLVAAGYRRIRARGDRAFRAAGDVLALVFLPGWGLVYAFTLATPTCVVDACGMDDPHRPFAASHTFGLVCLHAFVCLAYAASRRRPEALRPRDELTLSALLIVGIVVHAVIAIHFGGWLLAGILFPPVFLPCLSPVLGVVLFGSELIGRLRRRGQEALRASMVNPIRGAYRGAERELTVPATVHRGLLLRALSLSPVFLGMHFMVQAAWHGRALAALDVLTQTCGYTLSRVPIHVTPGSCHYLCTVAARGHRGLVRPERIGRRRGVPILVNRQLAIANAFEDLLHERWPRFGRLARGTYDAVGLPVSRYIRNRFLADAVYLAMKPAEWMFFTLLLSLDRRSPEERIDRMYR